MPGIGSLYLFIETPPANCRGRFRESFRLSDILINHICGFMIFLIASCYAGTGQCPVSTIVFFIASRFPDPDIISELCPFLNLCTLDDIVLNILAELYEECGVTCNTDQQIFVIFRMYLRICQYLCIDDVVLGVVDVQ